MYKSPTQWLWSAILTVSHSLSFQIRICRLSKNPWALSTCFSKNKQINKQKSVAQMVFTVQGPWQHHRPKNEKFTVWFFTLARYQMNSTFPEEAGASSSREAESLTMNQQRMPLKVLENLFPAQWDARIQTQKGVLPTSKRTLRGQRIIEQGQELRFHIPNDKRAKTKCVLSPEFIT